MDPDVTLEEIRELVIKGQNREDRGYDMHPYDQSRLLTLLSGLDTWITQGGFLPEDWQKGRSHGED